MKFTWEWLKAALIRALRTAAQVALGMFTVGMAVHEIDWMHVLSVTVVAAIYSIITSIATDLPELDKGSKTPIPDGSLVIDNADPDLYGVAVNFGQKTLEDIAQKDTVTLEVTVDNKEGGNGEKSLR